MFAGSFFDEDTYTNTYLGIPFAKPPLDELRWRPPSPVTPWTDDLETTTRGNNCASLNFIVGSLGDEEYVPKHNTSQLSRSPIIFLCGVVVYT